jgi:hypothetical protein
MSECYCDYEAPSVCHVEKRKARKEHRCCACYRTIRSGETYEHAWGIWDGEPSSHKTCHLCVELREYTAAHIPCFCWTFGSEGREDAMENLRNNAHLAPGLWFAGSRLYVKARRIRENDRRTIE